MNVDWNQAQPNSPAYLENHKLHFVYHPISIIDRGLKSRVILEFWKIKMTLFHYGVDALTYNVSCKIEVKEKGNQEKKDEKQLCT